MNGNGKIVINNDDINSSINSIDQSLSILESLNSMIPSKFLVLDELSFFGNGLSKISKQITSLSTSFENLMTKIAIHSKNLQDKEGDMARKAKNYSSQRTARVGSYYGGNTSGSNITVQDISQGISVKNGYSNEDIISSIKLLNDAEKLQLIEFLNANKGDINLLDLFNKKENSITLVKLLRKYYGDDTELQSLNIEDANLLRIELAKVLNSSFENSKLLLKEVLSNIASKENLSLKEFMANEQYIDLMNDLYLGKNLNNYNLSVSQSNAIKLYIDFCSKNSNSTVEETVLNENFMNSIIESR